MRSRFPQFVITLPIDTPLTAQGLTDAEWYKKMIRWYVKTRGCQSLFIDGTTGGWPGADCKDRKMRHRIGVETVHELGGIASVNIASGSVRDSLDFARAAKKSRPELLIAMLPSVPTSRSDADVVEFFAELSVGLPQEIPWGLYEFGSLLGPRLNATTLGQICELERAPVSIKWTDPQDPFAAFRIADAFHPRKLRVIPSHELAIHLSVQKYFPEFVSGALVPLPELAKAIEKFANAGRMTKVRDCQALVTEWLYELSLISSQPGRDFFKAIKAALAARFKGYPLWMPPGVKAIDEEAIHDFEVIIPGFLKRIRELGK